MAWSKNAARWLLLALLVTPVPSQADWLAKDGAGNNITFESFTNSSRILQKTVTVDTAGLQVGVSARPLFVQFNPGSTLIGGFRLIDSGGTNAAVVSALGRLSVDGSGVTQPVSGTVTSNVALAGTAVTVGNPIPTNCVSGCTTSDSLLSTYAASGEIVVAASATDIINIRGSASRLVKVRRIVLTGVNTTLLNVKIDVIRRSSANTGGTSTTTTVAQNDTTDPAATAVVTTYTVNPTSLGASAGIIRSRSITASVTDPPIQSVEMIFGQNGSKAILLRGASEFLGITGTATGSFTIRYSIEWTEE